MISFKGFNVEELSGSEWWQMYLLLLFYGIAVIPQVYCASFIFSEATGAFVKLVIVNIITGIVPMIVTSVLLFLGHDDVANDMEWIFMAFFPNYSLSQGINIYYMEQYLTSSCLSLDLYHGSPRCDHFNTKHIQSLAWCCQSEGIATNHIQWKNPGIGRMYFFLCLQFVGYTILLFIIELRVIQRFIYFVKNARVAPRYAFQTEVDIDRREYADNDVRDESHMVDKLTQNSTAYSLLVNKLAKVYGRSHRAVDEISFSVQRNDCFGLLGVNGAGKTSTFQMLTGGKPITSGDAYIVGSSVQREWDSAGTNVGYCPQFDALIENLTGRENLVMFARLRGIPENQINPIVTSIVTALGLTEFQNRFVKNYSGGMKRKLSLGAALVGEPPLLLLDEPTSGVDPSTRRFVWKILTQLRERGIAILLSSHSMEECEALCTRMAIMTNGTLRCIGTSQHLKSKFGNAYTIMIKVENNAYISKVHAEISKIFHNRAQLYIHMVQPPVMQYQLPVEVSKWSHLFDIIQVMCARSELGILDYSVSQTTLEQVFLSINDAENNNNNSTDDNLDNGSTANLMGDWSSKNGAPQSFETGPNLNPNGHYEPLSLSTNFDNEALQNQSFPSTSTGMPSQYSSPDPAPPSIVVPSSGSSSASENGVPKTAKDVIVDGNALLELKRADSPSSTYAQVSRDNSKFSSRSELRTPSDENIYQEITEGDSVERL